MPATKHPRDSLGTQLKVDSYVCYETRVVFQGWIQANTTAAFESIIFSLDQWI